MKARLVGQVLLMVLIFGLAAMAQEGSAEEKAAMMPMIGAPPQMKELAFLVGEWEVAMKMKPTDTSTTFTDVNGICRYTPLMDGAVMQMYFETEAPEGKFMGYGWQCYDRETKRWQVIWSDNVGSRFSLYEGERKGDTLAVAGKDRYQGMEYVTRISTFNETPQRFDWMMETSLDGGKTFYISGTAVYTKKK